MFAVRRVVGKFAVNKFWLGMEYLHPSDPSFLNSTACFSTLWVGEACHTLGQSASFSFIAVRNVCQCFRSTLSL